MGETTQQAFQNLIAALKELKDEILIALHLRKR